MTLIKFVIIDGKALANTDGYEYETTGDREIVARKILPDTKADIIKIVTDTMLFLAKQRLRKIFDQYGYNGLGDVQFYASQNDPEAQAILNLYANANGNGYDDLIWNCIDSLPNKTKAEILNDLQDLIAVEENIFNQATQNNPLP